MKSTTSSSGAKKSKRAVESINVSGKTNALSHNFIERSTKAIDRNTKAIKKNHEAIVENTKKLDKHDRQLEKVIDKLTDHDIRLERIERTMVTKAEFNEAINGITVTLDFIVKEIKDSQEECFAADYRFDRLERRVDVLETK